MANEYDEAWKQVITKLIKPFIAFTIPALYAKIDHKKPINFLNKEIHRVVASINKDNKKYRDKKGNLEVDILVEIPLRCKIGAIPKVCLLLHIEIQGRSGKIDISWRMNTYRQALEVQYKKNVIGLLIATQPPKKTEKLGTYTRSEFGALVISQYNVIEIYKLNEAELLKSDNPTALMFLAVLRVWKARGNNAKKIEYAQELLQILTERKYDENDIAELVIFMERVFKVDEIDVDHKYLNFADKIKTAKKGGNKMLISLYAEREVEKSKREGIEKGIKKGIEKGVLQTIAQFKRAGVAVDKICQATGLSKAKVSKL